MPRGLGKLQLEALRWLVEQERRSDTAGGLRDRHAQYHDRGGQRWIRAVPEGPSGLIDPDRSAANHRSVRAGWRRSYRGLERRGLVECRILPSRVAQQDSEQYWVTHEIVRDALVARSTQAGRDLVAELGSG